MDRLIEVNGIRNKRSHTEWFCLGDIYRYTPAIKQRLRNRGCAPRIVIQSCCLFIQHANVITPHEFGHKNRNPENVEIQRLCNREFHSDKLKIQPVLCVLIGVCLCVCLCVFVCVCFLLCCVFLVPQTKLVVRPDQSWCLLCSFWTVKQSTWSVKGDVKFGKYTNTHTHTSIRIALIGQIREHTQGIWWNIWKHVQTKQNLLHAV